MRIELPDDLKQCVEFHGHLCPGVVIGYCAAKLGMRELTAGRAGDEELIAIVENDTCAVDAIQLLTGCTFGKGNLFFRDYGKMVFTFAIRGNGKSVRLYLNASGPSDIDDDEPREQRRSRQIEFMLSRDPSQLFDVRKDWLSELPAPAQIRESSHCEACGERVMSTRLRLHNRQSLCIPCYERAANQSKDCGTTMADV